jgi:hypothetical protein
MLESMVLMLMTYFTLLFDPRQTMFIACLNILEALTVIQNIRSAWITNISHVNSFQIHPGNIPLVAFQTTVVGEKANNEEH